MKLISLTDCCHLLAIDPKTLRRWMNLADLSAEPSPLDARCKCLTGEQVQQLAAIHHRTLETGPKLPGPTEPPSLSRPTSVMRTTLLSDVRSDVRGTPLRMVISILGWLLRRLMGLCIIPKWAVSSDFSGPITDLTTQLGSLQAHVATLQHQLTLLTDQLQKEQQWRASVASTAEAKSLGPFPGSSGDLSPEKSVEPSRESSGDLSPEKSAEPSRESSGDLSPEKSVEPSREKKQARATANVPSIDERRHAHVLPWVEYGTGGKYVVICPERGMLEFEPDSPEWFAWLSELPSFRFMGKLGRFTAHRGSTSPERSWRASRHIRNRSYNQSLGKTESLTIAHLEQTAAVLQSHLN